MISGILGRKMGMLQIFKEGKCISVTILHVGPCTVMQVKKPETDGYCALQLGFDEKRVKSTRRSELGHAKKHANTTPKKFIREVEWDGKDEIQPGQQINLTILEKTKFVDIIGLNKGRGFQGVMRRHGFKGEKKTHGQSDRWRAPGSIGSSAAPARVMKGKRMGGQMGHHRCTVRNLKVIDIDLDKNYLAVNGSVPGMNGDYVIVARSVRG